MNGSRWLRLGAKALHDIAAISFGGGLAACLVINFTANRASSSEFVAARQVFSAIAEYVLIPSMAVVVVSGLIAWPRRARTTTPAGPGSRRCWA